MSTPAPGHVEAARLAEYEAIRLLVDRIRQVDPDLELTGANAAAFSAICNRLDGIPLALELAAARAGAMSLQDIATGLDDRFHLLTSGRRTAMMRHRTLRAAIDWSHDLLSAAEQTLFRRLAVFSGGWTREAAEVVCDGEQLARTDILETLLRLVDQSLVNVQVEGGRTRYRFLETVRAYAGERLQATGELAQLQSRHREWCLVFAERAAQGLAGPDQVTWHRQLSLEHDNIRMALDDCGEDPGSAVIQLRLTAAMGQFWWPRTAGEGRRRLAEALNRAHAEPSSARSAALTWQAMFELYYGDPLLGQAQAHAALVDARAIGDGILAMRALRALVNASDDGDATQRIALLEESLAIARASGAKGFEAFSLARLAEVAMDAGDLQRARAMLDVAEGLARDVGDVFVQANPLTALGWLAVLEGRLDDAESHFRLLVELGTNWGGFHTPIGLVGLGRVSVLRGDFEQARVAYDHMLVDLRETSAGSVTLADALLHVASLDDISGLRERAQRLAGASEAWHAAHGGARSIWEVAFRGPLVRRLVPLTPVATDAALARAREEGRAMTLDAAATHALESVDVARSRPAAI